ncbi:uncharacterized protein [Epargyreus clarus]|uniref:uncharacterized protein n=1 Tax=Epargyreus clarus TaxID=520877 RepID=UPI003C2B2066
MEVVGEETPKENASANALPSENVDTPVEETTPAAPPPQDTLKKSRREERLKVDKNVEQFMKSLNSVPTLSEQFSLVCKKYAQTSDENRKLHFFIKQTDKRFALIEKERDQLQLEYNKLVLVKSKLENLCRELQKQNKAVKEESLLKIREEEERRKETQAKFQNTLTEITALLQQNNEKNAKLRDDNINMTEKFKSVVQQYQLREQQVDKMAKQMSLESQLSDAKLQKAALEHQAEKERLLAESEQLKVTLAQYRAKILELQSTETALKGQLTVYTDKYDEFQNALVKSNQMFGGFKEQMEKMSKKIQKLEKESLSWKKRWETSQAALLDMCGERQASEERGAATSRHLQQMQSLCRTLQAERTLLLNTLKENNIERPPLPVLPPAPPVPQAQQLASNARVDAMAANCAQLRQSLAHIQSQLTSLTTNNTAAKEETPKPEKSKKSKSKKNKEKQAQKLAAEKAEVKEQESDDTNSQSISNEPQPTTSEVQNEGNENTETKIDSKTMNTLLQAINMANINLCDLEVNDDENDDNISKDAIVEEITDDIVDLNDITVRDEDVIADLDNVVSSTDLEEIEAKETGAVIEVISSEIIKPEVNDTVETKLSETPETKLTETVETILNESTEMKLTETVEPKLSETPETKLTETVETKLSEPVDVKLNETVETKLNEIAETNLNEVIPQMNGDETVNADTNKPVTNEANKLVVENIATKDVQLSPKKEKDIKEVVLEDKSQEDKVTQPVETPVSNES